MRRLVCYGEPSGTPAYRMSDWGLLAANSPEQA